MRSPAHFSDEPYGVRPGHLTYRLYIVPGWTFPEIFNTYLIAK
jgi:hypothetical protein